MARRKKKPVISTGSEHRKNIARCIELLGRVHNPWTVFNDFLLIAAISISNNCDPYNIATKKETCDEREKRYLATIKKYDSSEQKLFTSMLTELVLEMESYCDKNTPTHLTDVLGELFHELNFNDEWKGQFFTPQHICDMMGEMALGDGEKCKERIAEKNYFSVIEPCCGAGAIIYGMANAMSKIGLNRSQDVVVFAGDIDERCVFMTYIQCSLYGIPAIVQQRNALSNEVLSAAWFTPVFILNSWRWRNLWKIKKEAEL